jgi:hypothetical protein
MIQELGDSASVQPASDLWANVSIFHLKYLETYDWNDSHQWVYPLWMMNIQNWTILIEDVTMCGSWMLILTHLCILIFFISRQFFILHPK